MSLKERITEDMKTAMRAKDTARLSAIRLLLAAIKQKEVDERIVLDDDALLAIIEKQLKQRRDSVNQYEAAKREDLASAERFEIEVLSAYMPAGLSEAEIDAAVSAAIAETGASGPADMGKLMALLKPRLAGRADMSVVSAKIKTALAR
ncbi:GatB/YqeY domain-containing protein [Uliginosibacterium sediminicola]|uniref:GatB/YqeY domain-containing protein n=1 Tax=Uliginosibacterium sediminicola TaxID=2024550 RepID=A0ABU9YWN4_9RHOO